MARLVALSILLAAALSCTKGQPVFEELTATAPPATGPENTRITQGAGTASSANFKVKASVNFRGQAEATSPSFRAVHQIR